MINFYFEYLWFLVPKVFKISMSLSAKFARESPSVRWQNASPTAITVKSTFLSHVWNKGLLSGKLNDFVKESSAIQNKNPTTNENWPRDAQIHVMLNEGVKQALKKRSVLCKIQERRKIKWPEEKHILQSLQIKHTNRNICV